MAAGIDAFTPLQRAILEGDENNFIALLSEESAQARSGGGVGLDETALHVAARADIDELAQESMIRALFRVGADLDDPLHDTQWFTPLSTAVWHNKLKGVEVLLDLGASPNTQARDGFTPLYRAVQKGNAVLVRLLLERGADRLLPFHPDRGQPRTALDEAQALMERRPDMRETYREIVALLTDPEGAAASGGGIPTQT